MDKLHNLTKIPVIMRVYAGDWDGFTHFAQYSYFRVDSEADLYKLHVSGRPRPLSLLILKLALYFP